MVSAIVNLTKAEASSSNDTEFECLEALLDQMHRSNELSSIYPDQMKENLATVLVNDLSVSSQGNQIRQVWIALTFKTSSTKLTQARNAFYSYIQAASLEQPAEKKTTPSKSPAKVHTDTLVQSFVAKPI